MTKTMKVLVSALSLLVATCGTALATPSTQIWIPSTDVQPYKTGHLGIDNYFRANHHSSSGGSNVLDIGLTFGVLPFEKLQMEVGADYLVIAGDPNDNHPFSGNFKIGTPEGSLFEFSPAIAVGMYNIGPTQDSANAPLVTAGQNMIYGLIAKTIPAIGPVPSLGRLSAGYYRGSESALISSSPTSKPQNEGVLLSWDRTMSEISDKLWMAVDYQGGNNVMGALNVGASWAFAKNVSLIFGYDIYKEKTLAGGNTFTTQLDINFL